MQICPICGRMIEGKATFCPECGAQLTPEPTGQGASAGGENTSENTGVTGNTGNRPGNTGVAGNIGNTGNRPGNAGAAGNIGYTGNRPRNGGATGNTGYPGNRPGNGGATGNTGYPGSRPGNTGATGRIRYTEDRPGNTGFTGGQPGGNGTGIGPGRPGGTGNGGGFGGPGTGGVTGPGGTGIGGGNNGTGGNKSWMTILGVLAVVVLALGAISLIRGRGKKDPTPQYEQAESTAQTNDTSSSNGSSGGQESGTPFSDLFGKKEEKSGDAEQAEDAQKTAEEQAVEEAAEQAAAEEQYGEDQQAEQTAEQTPTSIPIVSLTPQQPAAHEDTSDVHNYEIVIADVTWEQAWTECIAKGGYLARINSREEMEAVIKFLNERSKTNIHFYLGGYCDTTTKQYHWIDETTATPFDENISDLSSWYGDFWYPGEPSYVDTEQQRNGKTIEEYYMNLFCVSGKWYFNDSTNDLVGTYPDWLRGKVGYIVEYE